MKIKIVGDAFVVTSNLAVSDIELLAKHNPDALKIKDEDGNDLFSVSYKEGKPSIANFGITFGGKTRGTKGLATYTGSIHASVADAKKHVAEIIGCISGNLSKVEKTFADAVDTVKAEQKALLDSITVCDDENDSEAETEDNPEDNA